MEMLQYLQDNLGVPREEFIQVGDYPFYFYHSNEADAKHTYWLLPVEQEVADLSDDETIAASQIVGVIDAVYQNWLLAPDINLDGKPKVNQVIMQLRKREYVNPSSILQELLGNNRQGIKPHLMALDNCIEQIGSFKGHNNYSISLSKLKTVNDMWEGLKQSVLSPELALEPN